MSGQDRTAATQGRYRELPPEQYAKGFIAGGYRVPFGPILRITDHGTYVVREPESVLPRV